MLVATGVLCLWGLGASGWANPFYSAAVQAGSQSWKAFFFGSSDAANAITVDKTPASLWPMALSVRLFGLNSWSILAPQALMGVATVGVVYAAVRRHFSTGAALLAGAVMALTPVAVLMFRFNNPDAMLVLLLTLGAYCLLRAQEAASTRWLAPAGPASGSRSWPRCCRPSSSCRPSPWSTWRPRRRACGGACGSCAWPVPPWWLRRGGGWRPWRSCPRTPGRTSAGPRPGRSAGTAAAVAVVVALAGPAAYAIDTAATPHTGAIPAAGPRTAGGPGFGGPPAGAMGRGGFRPPMPGGGTVEGGMLGGAPGGFGGGGFPSGRGGGLLNAGRSSATSPRGGPTTSSWVG
ncbi:ArnT family glycosyltransferase [Thermoactinospora rubra]|uniref:ArnT family glycosyltransferase n=1 Tax=Thermoactinospora rubra TaxID=1088767 RepID=UPI001F0B0919|nr:glycosyltransferase family 39 protein [Thermoactinospora rubra]